MTPLTKYPNYGTYSAVPIGGFPTTIAADGSWNSDLIPGRFGGVIAGVTSSQAGVLSVQRYADLAGNVPVGPVSSQDLTGGTPAWTGFADGLPYLCFAVNITNPGGTIANITDIAILTGPPL